MKKQILICLIYFCAIFVVNAQQWSGTTPNPIWTYSNVGIGTENPSSILTVFKTPATDEAHLFFGNPYSETQSGVVSSRLCFAGTGIQHAGLAWVPNVGHSNGDGKLHLAFGGHQNPMNNSIKVTFQSNGNVGIGTSTPVSMLDVRGDLYLNSGIDDNHIYWGSHNLTMGTQPGDYAHNVFTLKPGGASQGKLVSYFQMFNANSATQHDLKILFCTDGNSYFNGGNLGIGTSSPSYKLDVCGTIRAQEVKVEIFTGCDFVFKSDYELMDLKELEKFVKTNQHLPEIASEKEMVENGVNIKELQMKLLQKIEELTLYTIEQNEKLERQNEDMKAMKVKIEKLESASK